MVWAPAPYYWGGGFWGPWAVGVGTAVVLGELTDSETHKETVSYQVAPDSPGAKLLAAYQLTQVECGPPDLVVIWGPNNSPICARPNQYVAAGTYQLDPTNLTLASAQ
ncbi:MAG: hypothetical protein JO140_01470 [Candidatus Eremiobacteraeota bacterium]|nr:hypothetical protein [Candidatus Eremiobacteraeota bacterium]